MKMIEILKIEKYWPPVSTAAAAGLASRRGCGQQYHFVYIGLVVGSETQSETCNIALAYNLCDLKR